MVTARSVLTATTSAAVAHGVTASGSNDGVSLDVGVVIAGEVLLLCLLSYAFPVSLSSV